MVSIACASVNLIVTENWQELAEDQSLLPTGDCPLANISPQTCRSGRIKGSTGQAMQGLNTINVVLFSSATVIWLFRLSLRYDKLRTSYHVEPHEF